MGRLGNLAIAHLLMSSDLFNRWVKETFDQLAYTVVREFFEIYTPFRYSQHGYDLYASADPLFSQVYPQQIKSQDRNSVGQFCITY